MSSNTINQVVRTGAAARPEVPESVDYLSAMPVEIVTLIHSLLNPGEDNLALARAGRELRAKSLPNAVRCIRFERKKSATLQEVREVLAGNPGFRSHQPLELDLSGSDIADLELQGIIARFPNITSINATNCPALTNYGLQHLAALGNLTSLTLRGCRQITDEGVQHLALLTNLAFLSLRGCRQITDKGVQHLAALENFTFLILMGCPLVTDIGLQYLGPFTDITS